MSPARPVFVVELGGQRNAYTDMGCDEHPSCLRCPLEGCKYEDMLSKRMAKKAVEWDKVRKMLTQQTIEQVQLVTGYSHRHLLRLKNDERMR